jgi:hypothetical protein
MYLPNVEAKSSPIINPSSSVSSPLFVSTVIVIVAFLAEKKKNKKNITYSQNKTMLDPKKITRMLKHQNCKHTMR